MRPDTFAAARSKPLPWATAMEREFGRHTMTTGIPIKSNPVMLATWVMPICGSSGVSRASVSAGDTVRCVPRI